MPLRNNKRTRHDVLTRYFPQYRVIAPQATVGLGGAVLRQHHDAAAPAAHFRRQFRALKRLPADLAPKPHLFIRDWMAVAFIAGEIKSELPDTPTLAAMLYHLHRQPRLGWQVTLLPLLDSYWQQAAPGRRTPFWLAQLKRLRKAGEPKALRLAPLHMDVHAGNIVHTTAGEKLIDWEYAGDGDVALELAAVWMPDEASRVQLITAYVLMLMAGWFEMRLQQTDDEQFIALANDAWRQLQTKG